MKTKVRRKKYRSEIIITQNKVLYKIPECKIQECKRQSNIKKEQKVCETWTSSNKASATHKKNKLLRLLRMTYFLWKTTPWQERTRICENEFSSAPFL